MEELKKENPEYQRVDIKIIDEAVQPDFAKQFDYYYVPTYFVGDKKVHEGVASKDIVRGVYEEALK